MKKGLPRLILQIVLIALLVAAVVWFNQFAVDSDAVQDLVVRFGYVGIFFLSVASGFNLIVPVPVVAFFPFLLSAGFHPIVTVAVISFGMTTGDFLGFLIGRAGRSAVKPTSQKLIRRIEALQEKSRFLPYFFMFLYAAFSPVPNELVVIPLAFLGFRMWKVMVAVLLGNIIFNSIAAFGFTQFFSFIS